ncbi:hypothetical protein RRG08_023307 [Elysia crispata]|uniref:Uncharacterized protein n=1 Tax=Elysia crispata TaxID=231223 RepID=A0AAE1BC70_9GAST|nr:hypothetical protein RRG08_023307 [Elysia crispata]
MTRGRSFQSRSNPGQRTTQPGPGSDGRNGGGEERGRMAGQPAWSARGFSGSCPGPTIPRGFYTELSLRVSSWYVRDLLNLPTGDRSCNTAHCPSDIIDIGHQFSICVRLYRSCPVSQLSVLNLPFGDDARKTEGDLTQITGDYRKYIACGEWSVSRAHFELPDQTKQGGDTSSDKWQLLIMSFQPSIDPTVNKNLGTSCEV